MSTWSPWGGPHRPRHVGCRLFIQPPRPWLALMFSYTGRLRASDWRVVGEGAFSSEMTYASVSTRALFALRHCPLVDSDGRTDSRRFVIGSTVKYKDGLTLTGKAPVVRR